jgi:hypothetical protein
MALPQIVLLTLGSAYAAEVTRFPPALRGDVEIRYDVGGEKGRLLEDDTNVGTRRLTHHHITYTGTFSPVTGVALYVGLPHLASERVRFFNTQSMSYDPRLENGTMVNTAGVPDAEAERGTGMGGVWIGLKGAPMHRELFPNRSDRVSWVLDAGFRFRDKTNFWTYGPRGTRGAGPGAPAFRFQGSVSSKHRWAEPYLVTTLLRTGRITTDVVDENGQVVAQGLDLRPASRVDGVVGVEYTVHEYGQGAMVALDMHGSFGYATWQDIPSGLYLPSVLDASSQLPATMSEATRVGVGGGVNWRFIEYLQLNVTGDVGINTGGRVEHYYPVSVGMGALEWGVHTTLQFKVRDLLWEGAAGSSSGRADASPKAPPEDPPPAY